MFRTADWLAAAAVFTLPWSTSAASALIICWLVVALLILDFSHLPDWLRHPALALPVLLCLLAAAGMLWADVSWWERLQGLGPFPKLLAIPLLMIHFSRSDKGLHVACAYLISSVLLLAYSWASLWWPDLALARDVPGVPVKDSIYQSICFVIAIAALSHLAITRAQEHSYGHALLCLGLMAAYVVNIVYVATSRSALIILPVLLVVIAYQRIGKVGAVGALVSLGLLGSLTWATSPYLRERVTSVVSGMLHPPPAIQTSESMRIGFWRASLDAMSEAPILGHGTGSIRRVLDEAARQKGWPSEDFGIRNPHNQTFAVGIQLGALGVVVLLGMWLAHLRLFRGESWAARLGLLVVVQNVVASLFNSHLSDFTAGWFYVFGVGIFGGMALKQREGAGPEHDPEKLQTFRKRSCDSSKP